jgi:hypothetical protein
LKATIFIFLLGILAAELIVAEEKGSLSSRTFTTAGAGFNLDYADDQMAEHTIDERTIDRLGLFDPSHKSSRYSVELDLENEDSDWSFEVTITVEF